MNICSFLTQYDCVTFYSYLEAVRQVGSSVTLVKTYILLLFIAVDRVMINELSQAILRGPLWIHPTCCSL